MIELTENAITHLKTLTEKNKKNYVRLSVKGGGCAGFEYDWTFEDEEGYKRDDVLIEDLLLIDRMFEFYMLGMTLDYKEEIFGSQFVFDNPQASNSCGCGTSFAVQQ
tara:strand:+ start:129 stop:449 length:321 start_codon:yes stop_codon:yes gene_type:complete